MRYTTVEKLINLDGVEVKTREDLAEMLGFSSKKYLWSFLRYMEKNNLLNFNTKVRLTEEGKALVDEKIRKRKLKNK